MARLDLLKRGLVRLAAVGERDVPRHGCRRPRHDQTWSSPVSLSRPGSESLRHSSRHCFATSRGGAIETFEVSV
eukprot:1976936-Rhodomonas_salina.2